LLLTNTTILLGQGDRLTSYKNFFPVEAGTTLLIPTGQYEEIDEWEGPDDTAGEFKVSPKLSYENYFVTLFYSRQLLLKKKFNLSYKTGIGYQHYEVEIDKADEYSGGFTGFHFKGNITDIQKDNYIHADVSLQFNFLLTEKLIFTNQSGIAGNLLFHRYEEKTEVGTRTSKYSNEFWKLKGPGIFAYYKGGLSFSLNRNFQLSSQIEIPLYLFDGFNTFIPILVIN